MKTIVLLNLALITLVTSSVPGLKIDWQKVRPLVKIPKLIARYIHEDDKVRASTPVKRIFGGNIALPHSFPYQAGMLLKSSRGLNWCGGSIISEWYVITAAHCLDTTIKALVFIGAHEVRNPRESTQKRITVERRNFRIHSRWDPKRLQNDIALIKMPDAIEFNHNIQPIKLPSFKQEEENFSGKFATASGWGRFSKEAKSISPALRFVEIPVLSQSMCFKSYPGFLRGTNICTSGANGKSTCAGDSGGPLVLEGDGTKILIGITSFGSVLGCEKGFPGVYTRITSYLKWIEYHSDIDIE